MKKISLTLFAVLSVFQFTYAQTNTFPPTGNAGVGTTTPDAPLVVIGNIKSVLDPNPSYISKNVVNIIALGGAGITGAQNWTIRGVYQYGNGVSYNAAGGDLDIIKSLNGYTVLGTKYDGTALGNVLIGKTTQINPAYILDVAGNVRANQITVNATGADFVFEPTYRLLSLSDLKRYIDQNHHLPDIESAKQMQTDGLNVGDNQTKLLQKVEELTLYTISADKEIKDENTVIAQQQSQLKTQQDEIDHLKQQMQLLIKASNKH